MPIVCNCINIVSITKTYLNLTITITYNLIELRSVLGTYLEYVYIFGYMYTYSIKKSNLYLNFNDAYFLKEKICVTK